MGIIDRSREKMFHTMIFFIKNTKHCHKLKLFKLLYFFDFEVFRQTGRSVTGLEYFAWPMGPVPKDLDKMIKETIDRESTELSKYIACFPESFLDNEQKQDKKEAIHFEPKIKFNKKLFSIREQEIMKATAEMYKEAIGKDMTNISHDKNNLWHKSYVIENKKYKQILYFDILELNKDKQDTILLDEAIERESDYKEMLKNFG